jgi:hypothetical protein
MFNSFTPLIERFIYKISYDIYVRPVRYLTDICKWLLCNFYCWPEDGVLLRFLLSILSSSCMPMFCDLCTLALSYAMLRSSFIKVYHRNMARWKYLQGSDLCSVIFVMVHDRMTFSLLWLSISIDFVSWMLCLFLEFCCLQMFVMDYI